MYRVRQQDLPFQGSSHHFVGAENGDVNVSVFPLSALPARGPGPPSSRYEDVGPFGYKLLRRRPAFPINQNSRGRFLDCLGANS
jgi:hypothetical protein